MLWDLLPFGAIVAVCNLVDCRPIISFTIEELQTTRRPLGAVGGALGNVYDWTEYQLGNFTVGRFGWVLENVKALETPIPCRGRLGLFNVALDVPETAYTGAGEAA